MQYRDETNAVRAVGVGALGVVEIVFVILKLIGVIDWSWWVVLIPLFADIGLTLFFIILVVVALLLKGIKNARNKSL